MYCEYKKPFTFAISGATISVNSIKSSIYYNTQDLKIIIK